MTAASRPLMLVATITLAGAASAHHSDAGVDMSSVIAFEGTVREFAWKNPHAYFIVESVQDGRKKTWDVQMSSLNTLARRGWTPTTLVAGDRVTVRAHPAYDGRSYSILESVEKPGGLRLTQAARTPDVTPPAQSIAGRWLTDRASVRNEPQGGFDGFFRASLTPNDKGKAAQAAYDALSAQNPETTCVGRPTPAALMSSGSYLLEFEIKAQEKVILFRSEYFNEVRTVYMDGQPHPAANVRFATGHSIGHWEGDTLIVDTTNFADHRSPYQIGLPSGGQKHVVEKYRLTKDGTHIDVDYVLEDPEYLARPLTNHRQLVHSPHLAMFTSPCDEQTAGRFARK